MAQSSKDIFLEEAAELLAQLEELLLQLEQTPDNMDHINGAFRALHTLKGNGAMFGFTPVSEFAHGIEALFDDLRNGVISPTVEMISLTLEALDCFAILLRGAQACGDEQRILDQIDRIRGTKTSMEQPAQSPGPGKVEGAGAGFTIVFKPQPILLQRGARVEPLFEELRTLGTLSIEVHYDRLPPLESYTPTELYLWWSLKLETQADLREVSSVFMFVEDYAELTIEALTVEVEDTGPEATGAPTEKAPDPPVNQPVQRTGTSSIRVRQEKLDYLVDSVGELVILQARLHEEAQAHVLPELLHISETLSRLVGNIRDATMGIRMIPISESFSGFPRLVRDLSQQLGKDIALEIRGGQTEIDKNLVESLKDPLVHMVRNAADHGIESLDQRRGSGKPDQGHILIEARQQGSRVEIVIADDGAGLNVNRIKEKAVALGIVGSEEDDPEVLKQLIFHPGFSTAQKTTAVSGRGVGMDVVKSNIAKLRGTIEVQSHPGHGTRMIISIPLTLVIVDGLLMHIGSSAYVLTMSQVQECIDSVDLGTQGQLRGSVIDLRGKTIPIISMRKELGLEPMAGDGQLVLTEVDGYSVALRVDRVLGKRQVVIKPFTTALPHLSIISGATILGNGDVALILNINEIVRKQRLMGDS